MSPSSLRFSLIICTRHRPREVQRLLAAIRRQLRPPDETLIVDASAGSETEQVVRGPDGWADLRYYRVPPEHRGLTRQRNYGIVRAGGDLVAFLDDDTLPEPSYFGELVACFERHPEAIGVGGYVTNDALWHQSRRRTSGLPVFQWDGWERREDYRWRLRRVLGLVSPLPPGWMPQSGHGRPVAYLPPDGQDYPVEFVMGCSSAWRKRVFDHEAFSEYFDGYGLYEDLEFCIRAGRHGRIYLCTRARLAHDHAPPGRPNHFQYGKMVVRNGWFVWRTRWPHLSSADRMRWWSVTMLMALCRLGDGVRDPSRTGPLVEAAGRAVGMVTLLWDRPETGPTPVGETRSR